MKLIDEKGRIFGFLNIIDLIIILLLLGAIWGIFTKTAVLKRLGKNYTVSRVQIVVLVENVRQYTVDVVKPGDVIKELRSGEQVGVVKEVKVEDYKEKAPDAQGVWHLSPVPDKKNIYLTLEGNLKAYNKEFRAGQTDVKVGTKINLKSTLYNFESFVLKVQELEQK